MDVMGRVPRLFSTTLLGLVMLAALSPALSSEIPKDEHGLPLWETAEYDDFPVRLLLDAPGDLDRLLRDVPIASFHREQVSREQISPFSVQWVFEPRVTESEARALEAAGYSFERLPDIERMARRDMERVWAEQASLGGEVFARGERGTYHTHAQLGQILADAEAAHPDICYRSSIGNSVQGRELWTIVISDNVHSEEAEPEVRIAANMHGNEKIAMEMSIYLVGYLTDNYGQPGHEDVTDLVDNYEIHILPLLNPDGHAAGTRYNANGVDLNRNFPVPDGSIGEDGTWSEEVETSQFKDWGFAHHFVISQNGHSGALVVNYPWDYSYDLTPDNAAIIQLSEEYSFYNQPMWNGSFYHGITDGAQWYVVKGSLQDWSYQETGCIDVTIEFANSYAPPAGQLDAYWNDNRESFMHWIKAARYGINGVVTASDTGLPLAATVTVAGNAKSVNADPDFGDYYKLLDTGTYDISFSAPGYTTHTEYGVATTWGVATVLDVQLDPEAFSTVSGHVHEVGGVVPLDATLEIRSYPSDAYVTSAYSDAGNDGYYQVDLAYGDYTFYVSAVDHLPAQRQVTVNGPSQTQEFLLPYSETLVLFEDDFEAGTGNWTGAWGSTTVHYHSAAHSMTDSPSGDSGNNQYKPCTMAVPVNLSEVLNPVLDFWARWAIETTWDCVQLQLSTDGGASWTSLATDHTVPGSGQGAQPAGEPVYEGTQNNWVQETVDLNDWTDEPAVLLRFLLMTDGSVDEDGFYFDDFRIEGQVVATDGPESEAAAASLDRAWPNPFNPTTSLRFNLAAAGRVRLGVFDIEGRKVATLVDRNLPAGRHELSWNGRDEAGRSLPSGLYLVRLETDRESFQRKITLIK